MSDFSRELIKYWTLQRYLNYCFEHCDKNGLCYSHDGAAYHSEVMLNICPHQNMRKAVKILVELTSKNVSCAYALSGPEYSCIMKIVDAKIKESVIKI